ncbi:MAG: hypothetical protein HKN28_08110 [Alphaproteobacteria bacterium]|nr:hypothetical protein [Alphaproteobacteria bacterium]
MRHLRLLNLGLTALGAAVFGAMFLYLSVATDDFNRRARDVAVAEVSERFENTVIRLGQEDRLNSLSRFSEQLSERLEARMEKLRTDLANGIDVFVANILTANCKFDCEKREQARQAVQTFYLERIAQYQITLDRIETAVADQYENVIEELRNDLRIFSGSNFAIFLLAFLLTIFKGRASPHLLPISLSMTVATVVAATWYVFGQNWLMAILFNDFLGWAYLGIIAVITLLLIDIALNKARVTTGIINATANAVGSAFSVVPC